MSNLIIDSMNNDKIIVAKDRSKRPMDKNKDSEEVEIYSEYEKKCPFCRGNEEFIEDEKYKVCDKNGWIVKSVNNKFPIINDEKEDIYGIHEVMIDTYRHNGNFYNMTKEEFTHMFEMYKNRYKYFIKDKGIEYVSIFKNFLRKSGASLDHPHTQIISLSIVPPEIDNEINIAKDYYKQNKSSLYEDIINKEIKEFERTIYNGKYFLALVPYATKYSGEIRVISKDKIRFENMENKYIDELSKIFEKLFKKLYKVRGYSPFNLYIHTHPTKIKCDEYYNFHMHIIPRKYSFGGFELSTGLYVSSINPSEFANKLRFDNID